MAQQAPFGDAFLVQTPALDRMANQLYTEQKQRQLMYQKNAQVADESLQKEIGKIRSADTPEVLGAYENFKKLSQQALTDKSLQNDPIKRNQLLQQAQLAKANLMQMTADSQELLNQGKGLQSQYSRNPKEYSDDFGGLITAFNSTPMSQLSNSKYGDLRNPDTYRYKGTNTDFSKILTAAAGQPKQVHSNEAPVDQTGLQTKITPYTFGNTPMQFRDSLLGSLSQRQAGRDAEILWEKVPQTDRDAVDQAFAAVPQDKWVKAGIPNPQDLPTNTGNSAVDFANFQAKKYFLANEPKEGTPVFRTNEAKKFQMETDRQKTMERLRHADAKDLIDYKKRIDPNDKELNDLWVDKVIENLKEDAKSGPTVRVTENGKVSHQKNIPLDPVLASSLQKGGITPLYMAHLPNGKFRVIYPLKDKEGNPLKLSSGDYAIDESLSVPISEDQLGLALGKKNVTGKQRGKEILNVINNGAKPQGGSWKDRAKKVD